MPKLSKEQLAQAIDQLAELVVKQEAHLTISQEGIEICDRCMNVITAGQDGTNAIQVLHDL